MLAAYYHIQPKHARGGQSREFIGLEQRRLVGRKVQTRHRTRRSHRDGMYPEVAVATITVVVGGGKMYTRIPRPGVTRERVEPRARRVRLQAGQLGLLLRPVSTVDITPLLSRRTRVLFMSAPEPEELSTTLSSDPDFL